MVISNLKLIDIMALIDKLDSSSLDELVIKNEGQSITLRRNVHSGFVAAPVAPIAKVVENNQHAQINEPPHNNVVHSQSSAPSGAERAHSVTEQLYSPIVGTFYITPSPDSPPLCNIGDSIKKGTVLCILEAMKIMNEFEAEFDMEIISILVDNTTPVEYGTPIFEVKRI